MALIPRKKPISLLGGVDPMMRADASRMAIEEMDTRPRPVMGKNPTPKPAPLVPTNNAGSTVRMGLKGPNAISPQDMRPFRAPAPIMAGGGRFAPRPHMPPPDQPPGAGPFNLDDAQGGATIMGGAGDTITENGGGLRPGRPVVGAPKSAKEIAAEKAMERPRARGGPVLSRDGPPSDTPPQQVSEEHQGAMDLIRGIDTQDPTLSLDVGSVQPGQGTSTLSPEALRARAIAELLGQGPMDTSEEERLITEMMEQRAGADALNAGARMGRMGFGQSGAGAALEGDLRRQAAREATEEILGTRRDARGEWLQRVNSGLGFGQGEERLAQDQFMNEELLKALQAELGIDDEEVTDLNGDGKVDDTDKGLADGLGGLQDLALGDSTNGSLLDLHFATGSPGSEGNPFVITADDLVAFDQMQANGQLTMYGNPADGRWVDREGNIYFVELGRKKR